MDVKDLAVSLGRIIKLPSPHSLLFGNSLTTVNET